MLGNRRVVVTGLGAVTPVGATVDSAWQAIVSGKSGIKPIKHFSTENFPIKISGTADSFDVEQYFEKKEARKMDPFMQMGIASAEQAVCDAGLNASDLDPYRIGVAVGSGIGGISTITHNYDLLTKGGARKVSPFFIPAAIINLVAGHISIRLNFKGPNISVATACTTGTHNIGLGARAIAYGDADAMIVGGAECANDPLSIAGFASCRALSKRNDSPEQASRPWDRDRDGFVLGEGAGVLVLEEYEQAKARGARIYAELKGFGMSGDAYHMTAPDETGHGAARAMQAALKDADIPLEQIGYINAHGTSTPAGDMIEVTAVKTVFGNAYKKLAMSSTKSMTGHLLGAAGAIEAIFTIKALNDQIAPPTINLDNPSEGCDLNLVPHEAQKLSTYCAMSNSFGFGGTNGTLIFSSI